MEQRDLASDLEFWGGRGRDDASGSPRRPRPSPHRRPFVFRVLRVPDRWVLRTHRSYGSKARLPGRPPSPRRDRSVRRTRPIAAAVLIAALTGGWLAAGHRSRAAGSSASPATPFSAPGNQPVSSTVTAGCAARTTEPGAVHCVLDGVRLDVRAYPPGTAAAAYRRASGVGARPHTGPPACERGTPDERAWSEPGAPAIAVGRYRCALENGRAAMWWTRGDRLAHAVAANRDLAALFTWWRSHPAE
jgi:hypothetical protein